MQNVTTFLNYEVIFNPLTHSTYYIQLAVYNLINKVFLKDIIVLFQKLFFVLLNKKSKEVVLVKTL